MTTPTDDLSPKPVLLVPIPPPPDDQRVGRGARFAQEGERRGRYHLPDQNLSASPVGYRRRLSLTRAEGEAAMALLSLTRPDAFVPAEAAPTEGELFEEASLGVLSSRQSTNFRGFRAVLLGTGDSDRAAAALAGLAGLETAPLTHATHTWLVLSRPYRTPFTLLLTFVGHKPVQSLLTVPQRAWNKRQHHIDDIPTIGFLPQLHLGILADGMERAAVLASGGRRRALVHSAPFVDERRAAQGEGLARLEALAGLTDAERAAGWRLSLVAQVGEVEGPPLLDAALCRKLGASLLAFRSERAQPGVNADEKAPAPYQTRQDVDVPDALVEQAGRAAFNAFSHWTGLPRERAKALLLMERVDVLTPGGKERLREIRRSLEDITDRTVAALPLWADLPLGRALSKNAERGRKAFALAGQRVYIGGLSRAEVAEAGLPWSQALRAFGAAAARSALVAELGGVVELPPDCDLLGGVCLMAGPVNQNDVGKQFFGVPDLLASAFPGRDPTSLLVWTLKAKTVADPIGNEEQLQNPKQKGALVDLRPAPHEVVALRVDGRLTPMRSRDGRVSGERAFADQDNFVTDPDGVEIPGNRGSRWPEAWRAVDPFSPPPQNGGAPR
ncbi:hypothetical protein L6R49_13585 [Myxococcota bacterium]|nr:hypothetical protein [Myxococcota bacterium]